MEEKQNDKEGFLVVAVLCALCLSILVGVVGNVGSSTAAHAQSGVGGSFNEEYDALYADIVDRYEQTLITYEEAEEEYMLLSQSGIT